MRLAGLACLDRPGFIVVQITPGDSRLGLSRTLEQDLGSWWLMITLEQCPSFQRR